MFNNLALISIPTNISLNDYLRKNNWLMDYVANDIWVSRRNTSANIATFVRTESFP